MQAVREQNWCSGSSFSSFWSHYDAVEKWRRSHSRYVNAAITMGTAKQGSRCGGSVSQVKGHNKDRDRIKNEARIHDEDIEDESMEFENSEISDEYLEFRKKTLEHQQQRDAKRNLNAVESKKNHWIVVEEDDYVEADKMGINKPGQRTLNAPDEQSKNEKRRKDAKILYGEMSEKILAMETAMDMRFTEEYRRKQPPMWPSIPLKF